MFRASRETKKRALIASALFGLFNIWFLVCEKTIVRPEYIMYLPLDSRIPFVPQFIIPYYMWHAYVSLPMVWLFFKAPEDYVRGMTFYAIALFCACAIYTIAPNGQRLRPHILGDGFFERWVAFTYSADSPNNVAPSLHVLDSIAIHAALVHCEKFRKHRVLVIISTVLCVACSISTVFVKQHSVIDVFMGAGLGALIWACVYGRAFRRVKPIIERRKI